MPLNLRQPHFVREYRSLVRTLRRRNANDETGALERAVGGHFKEIGAVQRKLILDRAPAGPFFLLDVGCGSGRTARALADEPRISYLGLDVAPELVAHARRIVDRDDWRFEVVTSLELPVADGVVDVAIFMSVFTHLKPAEVRTHLGEAFRVLKPGGLVLASYLERDRADHVAAYRPGWRQAISRFLGNDVMITFVRAEELKDWAIAAGLEVVEIDENCPLGQHLLVARKPA